MPENNKPMKVINFSRLTFWKKFCATHKQHYKVLFIWLSKYFPENKIKKCPKVGRRVEEMDLEAECVKHKGLSAHRIF